MAGSCSVCLRKILALPSRLDSIKGVDNQVNREGRRGARLESTTRPLVSTHTKTSGLVRERAMVLS